MDRRIATIVGGIFLIATVSLVPQSPTNLLTVAGIVFLLAVVHLATEKFYVLTASVLALSSLSAFTPRTAGLPWNVLGLVFCIFMIWGRLRTRPETNSVSSAFRPNKSWALAQVCAIGLVLYALLINPSWATIWSWLVGLLIVISASYVKNPLIVKYSNLALGLGLSATLLIDASLALSGKGFLSGDIFNSGRFLGALGDYELSAEKYGVAMIFGVYQISKESRNHRLFGAFLFGSSAWLISLTGTRGPWVALAIAALAVYFIRMIVTRQLRVEGSKKNLPIFWGVIVLTLALASSSGLLLSRFAQLDVFGGPERGLNRESVWALFTSASSFVHVPLLGNGLTYPYDQIGTFPHSLYLFSWWAFGPLGCLAILITVLSLLIRCTQHLIHSKSGSATLPLMIFMYLAVDQTKIEFVRYPDSVIGMALVVGYLVLQTRRSVEDKIKT